MTSAHIFENPVTTGFDQFQLQNRRMVNDAEMLTGLQMMIDEVVSNEDEDNKWSHFEQKLLLCVVWRYAPLTVMTIWGRNPCYSLERDYHSVNLAARLRTVL